MEQPITLEARTAGLNQMRDRYRVELVSKAPSICRTINGEQIGFFTDTWGFSTRWGAGQFIKRHGTGCTYVYLLKRTKRSDGSTYFDVVKAIERLLSAEGKVYYKTRKGIHLARYQHVD